MIHIKINHLLRILSLALALLIVYFVVQGIVIAENTGVLSINSIDKNANIVISQSGHQALHIGIGAVRVRLTAGTYQVSAFDSGKQASATVSVIKKKGRILILGPLTSYMLPTLSGVNFSGFSELTNQGMQSSQLASLETGLFKFSPYTKTIGILAGSLNFPAFSPDNPSTLSTVSFKVLFDKRIYIVTCDYDNLSSSLDLKLFDVSTNAQIYQYSNS